MLNQTQYAVVKKVIIGFLLISLFFLGTLQIYILTDVLVWLIMVLRVLLVPSQRKFKWALAIVFTAILPLQIIFNITVIFAEGHTLTERLFARFIGVLFLLLPLVVERAFTYRKNYEYQLPSLQELSVVSFAEIKNNGALVMDALDKMDRAGESLSKEKLEEILRDLPRHDSLRYINNGSLTEAYFEKAYESIHDPHLYIVISDTGSPASELISVFTQKKYNHASLAFDYDLHTIISYNGGERVYPPGLNHEMLSFFNKKEDSTILVYSIVANYEQKRRVIDKIRQINEEGSAYNIMGLLLKYSHKPNILYCSQFVYKMLKLAGIAYFEKKENDVKPTDLIELDYYRRLQFAYELKLRDI